MKKRGRSDDVAALARAVGSLIRRANADLKDASLLSSGRNPGNAPRLVGQAFDALVLAVIATERGWPMLAIDADPGLIPAGNPLRAALEEAAKAQTRETGFPGVLPDGNPAPGIEDTAIRASIASTSRLLNDLAGQLGVDLFGAEPAGRPFPVRPEPVPAPQLLPPKPTRQPAAKPAPAPTPVPAAPRARKLTPKAGEAKSPPFAISGQPPLRPAASQEVAGRAPIELNTSPNSTTGTVFWALMDKWKVSDLDALALIGHPGGLTKTGGRPRFKLVGKEVTVFRGLQEMDSALASLGLEPGSWLAQAIEAAPFGGLTPVAYLTRGREAGVRSAMKFILQQGLKLSMSASPGTADASAGRRSKGRAGR